MRLNRSSRTWRPVIGCLFLGLSLTTSTLAGEPDSTPTGALKKEAARTGSAGQETATAEVESGTPAQTVSADTATESLASLGDHMYTVEDVVAINEWLSVQRVLKVQNASLSQPAPEPSQPLDLAPSPLQPLDLGQVAFDLAPDFIQQADPVSPLSESVTTADNTRAPANDVGGLLDKSNYVQTIGVQRRSPINLDPHIRGYSFGQVRTIADGTYWTPVRQDLDSMLSKIDPWLIRSVTVIPGPYGLRYGPGFSYINIETFDTPRYACFESHARLGTTVHTNGGQVNGRATAFGGNSNYGYVFSYTNRVGGAYQAGSNSGLPWVPTSFHMQSMLGQFGFDIDPYSRVEIRYNRVDQPNTEFAAQIFDIDYLGTDAISINYIQEDPSGCEELRVAGWFNRTRFNGDTLGRGKRNPFFVIDRIEDALRSRQGVTGLPISSNPQVPGFVGANNGDLTSTGARIMKTYGDEDYRMVRFGADIRNVQQQIYEQYRFYDSFGANVTPVNPLDPFNPDPSLQTNLPRSTMIDPGLFMEATMPWLDYMSTSIGARVDWTHTDAQQYSELPLNFPDGLRGNPPGSQTSLAGAPGTLPQNDTLFAFYVTNNLALTDSLDVRFGGGHAQRIPTLTERYADGVFMGIIQNGFSRVIGTPNLRKERAWQLDLTFELEREYFRGRASLYHSWVLDYVTYAANPIADPTGARLLLATNTDRATLAGFSLYGECDATERLQLYASANYVQGTDRSINAPLPQIAPLEGRAGVRFHQAGDNPRWGVDFGSRIVSHQPRNAFLRPVGGPGSLLSVEEETAGFTLFYLRGFWRASDRLYLVGGVENLLDKTYLEHLDLRLPDNGSFTNTRVYSPGITPYAGFEWVY